MCHFADEFDRVLLEDVLCCPRCHGQHLKPVESTLQCASCGWHSEVVSGDTISFASTVYDSAQTQTKRKASSCGHQSRIDALKQLYLTLSPTYNWINKDEAYWRSATMTLRERELNVLQQLVMDIVPKPRRVLVELGVGYQDHCAFYARCAEHVICSDIYRDQVAAEAYARKSNVCYCLINAEELPFQDNSIDILFTSHVIEHLPDRNAVLRALHSKLKPDAVVCHIVPISAGFALGHLVGTVANLVALVPKIGRGIHGEYESVWQEMKLTTVKAWQVLFQQCGFKLLADAPGTLGLTPLRPTQTLWLSDKFHLYSSWVFVMQVVK